MVQVSRTTAWRATRLAGMAAMLALAGCSYAYKNPAEELGPGEVGGRTVAGVEVLIDGVAVSVKGGALDATSRANGHFSMLPLPVGRHTLMFRKGKERALQREVEIAYGKDGQPQGLWLGDVTVPAAVGLAGTAAATDGAYLAENGIAVDEVSGAIVPVWGGSYGDFTFEGLSIGEHRVRIFASDEHGTPYVGGPATVQFLATDAGTQKVLSRIPLHRASTAPADAGGVKVTVSLAGSVPGLTYSDLTVSGLPAPVSFASDGSAQVEVPEGLWTVTVHLPASVTGVTPPPPVTFVAVAGKTIDLGTLYAVSDAAQSQAALSCRSDADCAPAPGTCTSSHVCTAWTPPPQAPASVPWCNHDWDGCTAGTSLGGVWNSSTGAYDPPYTLACVAAASATVGVACGSCCTPDGVAQACAVAGVGACATAAAPTRFAISGTVSDGTGAGVSGVQVWITSGADTGTNTDATGAWAITGLANGSYTLTPYLPGYTFIPASLDVVVSGADVPLLDFVAVAPPLLFTISGTVSGAVAAGVTVQLSGAASAATTADATGAWSFTGVADGSYTVTPSLAGYAFSPASRSVFVSGAAVGGLAFTSSLATGAWVAQASTTTQRLWALWGSSPSDVWSVGTGGTILRWNGSTWASVSSPTTADLQGIWGSAANDVWAVGGTSGAPGVVLHWDGAAWSIAANAAGNILYGVWGSWAKDVWAVGWGGVEHWDGTSWTSVASGTGSYPMGVGGTAVNDAWAVAGNGTIIHWDGTAWTSVANAMSGLGFSVWGVWGSSPSDVWAGAYSKGGIQHWDGTAWTAFPSAAPSTDQVNAIWGASPGDVFSVAMQGSIQHWNGNAWSSMSNPVNGTATNLWGTWGTGAGDVWAVGDGGTILHMFSSAEALAHAVSGTVISGATGAPQGGVTMTLSGASHATATTDASGTYHFAAPVDGSYTITPTLAGSTFTPASRTVTVSGTDVPLQDFTAVAAPVTTVYATGYRYVAGQAAAFLLTDWVETFLPGLLGSTGDIVLVSGPDVYVLGNGYLGGVFTGAYWKNGVVTTLGDGVHQSRTSAIAVSGTDVYVSGIDYASGSPAAQVWHNGVATGSPSPLAEGTTANLSIAGIGVLGPDVYVSGSTYVPATGFYAASLWKNGVKTLLTSGAFDSRGGRILVSGADLYVMGSEKNGAGVFEGRIWVNPGTPGAQVISLGGGVTPANVYDLAVSGADLYAVGYQLDAAGAWYAMIWKNGAGTVLASSVTGMYASSVSVAGPDVWVAGQETIPRTSPIPNDYLGRTWLNDLPFNFPGAGIGVFINGVAAVRR